MLISRYSWRKKLRERRRKIKSIKLIPSRFKKSRNFVTLAKLGLLGAILFVGLTFFVFVYFAFTLPSPDEIVRKEGFSSKIYDRNGEVLYDIFLDAKRTPVEMEDIPEFLKNATIAIEDKNFYKHEGIDPVGMLRGVSRVFTRGRAQGGSTLTQQLVKNVLLSPERTIFRKIKEFILTVQIERKFSKDEILKMYMNEVPYGGTAIGVQAASEMYFGKKVNDLDLVESAILAGLPQRPSFYSPYSSDKNAYVDRATQVLRRMREDGYINSEQEEEAVSLLPDVIFQERDAGFKAPHFVQYVQKILESKYGEEILIQGGLRVTTTLDLDLQEKAQKIVSEEIAKVENLNITNGASVVIDPQTGEILAMVGSKNFSDPNYDGQVNVTMALRQPGSAIKPITYAAALKKGYTASTLLMDVPTEFPAGPGQPLYKPVNYDGKYRGPIQVRYALGNSINVPAVKILAMVGIREVLDLAYEMGIESLEPTRETLSRVGLSVTLGGGEVRLIELTNAFAAFANEGYAVEPVAILKVEDANGKLLEEVKPEKKKRVLTEEQAFIIADILSDNGAREMVFGSNSLLNFPGRKVAVKTGTTNDRKDNWTVGGTPQVVVGVWVGNNDNSSMTNVASGVTGASPIWRRILLTSLEGKSDTGFKEPAGIVVKEVDRISGYEAHDGFPSRMEFFVKGTEPGNDPVHLKLKVCRSEGKLATPSDIVGGNYEEREFLLLREDDPLGSDGVNRWQDGINAWISTQPVNEMYFPPTDYCSGGVPINVEFETPRDRDSNLPNTFNIRVRIDSINEIEEVYFEIDGTKIKTFSNPPYSFDVNLEKGVHNLRAVAKDKEGKESDRRITIGVQVDWDYTPPPAPTLSP
jgi:1A family penicillin-binding protein